MPSIIRVADPMRAILLLCLSLLTVPQGSAAGMPWELAEARFGFRGIVEGEGFEVVFDRFTVAPRLDAEFLPRGFDVEIDLVGLHSGNADRDAEMVREEWLDVDAHPVARFRADRVSTVPGGYLAQGELTLKGVTRALSVPFSWRLLPRGVEMRGELVMDRRWFAVGPVDDSSVQADVTVFYAFTWGGTG